MGRKGGHVMECLGDQTSASWLRVGGVEGLGVEEALQLALKPL